MGTILVTKAVQQIIELHTDCRIPLGTEEHERNHIQLHWVLQDLGILTKRAEAAEAVILGYKQFLGSERHTYPAAEEAQWQQAKAEYEKVVNDAN